MMRRMSSTSASQGKAATFFASFAVLRGAARELWLTFLIKFLIAAAFEITFVTFPLWLSSDLGMNDQTALAVAGAWGVTMTGATLLVGSLTDALGLRRTFFLGVWICLIARVVMTLVTVKWVALSGLFLLAIGEALGTPVLIAATRVYSNTRQRSFSFSLIYVILNLGFLVGSTIFDWVRQSLGEHGHWSLPLFGGHLTAYRVLFLVSWVIELLVLPAVWFLRDGVEVTDDGITVAPARTASPVPHGSIWKSAWATVHKSGRDTADFFVKLVAQPGFYRLLSFLLLVACLKVVYTQLFWIFPKWGLRELGDGAPLGHLLGLNFWFIIFLVPIIGALTQRYSAYRMVILGGLVTATSVFIMALPPQWFLPLANSSLGDWIGRHYLGLHGAVHPYYVMTVLFVIVLSFGEAFYSPRVYEYAAAIAPKGREASYGALSYIPSLASKLLVALVGGTLLAKFCPQVGERHSSILWLLTALAATIAPVGLLALQRYIRVPEAGREDSDPKEDAAPQ